ncbi:hypothetical protein L249_0889 [Ophiocordyceps polyrhachis-furcata BCC 54312]|uniref:Uncharacterized protein n=1 Tax=Ophiocordyceps polyrhachis-furcata BCC 54312 TaxID=1330021 RepID=A0A367LCF5_9HYPO|nr:hypothetical protein L249_0889 [Ophiocordyceps polyrhachis-furcata BCC 54312]
MEGGLIDTAVVAFLSRDFLRHTETPPFFFFTLMSIMWPGNLLKPSPLHCMRMHWLAVYSPGGRRIKQDEMDIRMLEERSSNAFFFFWLPLLYR